MYERNKPLIIKKIENDYQTIKHPFWDGELKFTKDICLQSEIKHEQLKNEVFDSWRSKIGVFDDNKVFKNCITVNGISKNEFLKRFLTFRPTKNTQSTDCIRLLTQLCNDMNPQEVINRKFIQNTDKLDKLCSVFASMEWRNQLLEWLMNNDKTLWKNIAGSLALEENLFVPELCIATAYFVYKTSSNLTEKIIPVLENLVHIVLSCCAEFDKYTSDCADANDAYQLGRRQIRNFFFPTFKSQNVNFMLLSTAFYCEAFILNYFFTKDVIEVFLPMIEEMTEVGKYLHLNLLTLIVEKIEAQLETDPENEDLIHIIEFIFEETINFSIDKNVANKSAIININSIIRSILQSLTPNTVGRFRRKSSYEMKITIARRKNKEETEIPGRSSGQSHSD